MISVSLVLNLLLLLAVLRTKCNVPVVYLLLSSLLLPDVLFFTKVVPPVSLTNKATPSLRW